jgi:hypothetical protein
MATCNRGAQQSSNLGVLNTFVWRCRLRESENEEEEGDGSITIFVSYPSLGLF